MPDPRTPRSPKVQWAWHIHHEKLLEPLTEPIENRIAYVQAQKPANEVELRLRLLKPVRGDLTKIPAYAAWEKAEAACQKADAAWVKAIAAREKAYAARQKAVAAREKAYAARQKAEAACQKAVAAWQKAVAAREKAYAALTTDPAVLALHAQECPSPPCTWDGTTIFPEAFIGD